MIVRPFSRAMGVVLAFACAACAVCADTPALLHQAILKIVASDQHWAYTLTSQAFDIDRKPKGGPTIEQFDPSQPYGHQWTLVEFKGHPPTADERASWQKRKNLVASERRERNLGEVLDLEHATLISENPLWANYDVPILKDVSSRFPSDKLQVIMHVDKTLGALVSFRVQQRDKFRIEGIASVDDLEVTGHLLSIDPQFAPVLASIKWDGAGHVLGFYKLGFGSEQTYSNYRRVIPYAQRMGLKGPDSKTLNLGT